MELVGKYLKYIGAVGWLKRQAARSGAVPPSSWSQIALNTRPGLCIRGELNTSARRAILGEVADKSALIIGINYSPEPTGIAPYTSALARYLSGLGSKVVLVTGMPHYPEWKVPAAYRVRRLVELHDGIELVRLRHFVPSRASTVGRVLYEATFALHVSLQRVSTHPDVVIAVSPALGSTAVAGLVARRMRVPLLVWVQDLVGPGVTQSGTRRPRLAAAIASTLEGWVFRRADVLVVLNEKFRSYAVERGVSPGRVVEVPNWTHVPGPSSCSRAAVREANGWSDHTTVVLHAGNMGQKQALENIVAAARAAQSSAPRFHFVFMGDGNQRRLLEALADGMTNVSFKRPVPLTEFTDILAAADVLLISERASAEDMSVQSKLTSYLAVPVPIVAAVPSGGGTAAAVRQSGAGLIVPPGDSGALLEALSSVAYDKKVRDELSRSGSLYGRDVLGADKALESLAIIVAQLVLR